MSYIAPITHYQYSQYAERDMGNEHDPFQFVPVNKVNHTVNAHPFQQQLLFHKTIKKWPKKPLANKLDKEKSLIDKAFAEVTGKGKHFSEVI